MANLKTKPSRKSVEKFLREVDNERRRQDAFRLLEIMHEVSGEQAKMWGDSLVGFGSYHYKYGSGREGDWLATGFSPRKQNLTVYIMPGFGKYQGLLKKLGKHKTGRSCLYINKLADVDEDVLRELIALSLEHIREIYAE